MKRVASSILLLTLIPLVAAYADNFQFSTDHMTTVLAKGKEHTILTGNAKVTNGDTVITANQIELYGPSFRYANATGDVKVVDAKRGITLTSQNLYYDRTDDLSRVEGYAVMQDTKNELVVKGGFLENRGNAEITIVQIGVRILKIADNKEMVCRSQFARYDRKTDSLLLSGMPVVYWKGDEYRAAQISIDLKTDEINLEGEVSGKIVSEGSSSNGSGKNGSQPSSSAGASTSEPSSTPSPGNSSPNPPSESSPPGSPAAEPSTPQPTHGSSPGSSGSTP